MARESLAEESPYRLRYMLACKVPDFLQLTFADGTSEQIEVERGRADQEFEDLRHLRGRYEGGWLIGASESERWKWLNINAVVSVDIHRDSDLDPGTAALGE